MASFCSDFACANEFLRSDSMERCISSPALSAESLARFAASRRSFRDISAAFFRSDCCFLCGLVLTFGGLLMKFSENGRYNVKHQPITDTCCDEQQHEGHKERGNIIGA